MKLCLDRPGTLIDKVLFFNGLKIGSRRRFGPWEPLPLKAMKFR